jgi:flagellar protein FliJ
MFKFPLQRVLELRAKREKEIAGKLVEARSAADDARERADAITAVRDAGRQSLTTTGGASLTIGEIRHRALVLDQLTQHVHEAKTAATRAEDTAVRVQHDLTAALVERRILDRLRDRLLDEYKTGEVKLDRSTMDDIATTRFVQSARRGESR